MVDNKVFENRVRWIASRQALRLQSNRRRDRLAIDYGFYRLADSDGQAITPFAPLDVIEKYLITPRDERRPWSEHIRTTGSLKVLGNHQQEGLSATL